MTRLSDAAVGHLRSVALAEGRYTLLEPIGEGGMGIVYRGHDAELDREVAIKVLRSPDRRDLLARFAQEARVLARLEHPGIVPVHDAGRLPDGRPFYVMTLVRGRPLSDAGALPPTLEERLRLFQRVSEPVAFAHSRGIVHRDLKPANIMIGPFGEALVMDWGVAKVFGAADHGAVLGTAGYMAPEQAAGDSAEVDQRADLFGLGAILRDLAEGAPPVPKPVAAIAARAMAGRPEERYATVSELSADIESYLDGRPVAAYRESPIERLVRVASRHRTAIILVLAYLVMRLLLLLLPGRP